MYLFGGFDCLPDLVKSPFTNLVGSANFLLSLLATVVPVSFAFFAFTGFVVGLFTNNFSEGFVAPLVLGFTAGSELFVRLVLFAVD